MNARWLMLTFLCLGMALTLPAPASEEKPFAEAHIVLQLGDGDEATQGRVLNVANNLIKHYGGPEFVDLEIVGEGGGNGHPQASDLLECQFLGSTERHRSRFQLGYGSRLCRIGASRCRERGQSEIRSRKSVVDEWQVVPGRLGTAAEQRRVSIGAKSGFDPLLRFGEHRPVEA